MSGFPIRTSTDQCLVGSSPWLIAVSHVLFRLQTPRHPPIALSSLEELNIRARYGVLKDHIATTTHNLAVNDCSALGQRKCAGPLVPSWLMLRDCWSSLLPGHVTCRGADTTIRGRVACISRDGMSPLKRTRRHDLGWSLPQNGTAKSRHRPSVRLHRRPGNNRAVFRPHGWTLRPSQ